MSQMETLKGAQLELNQALLDVHAHSSNRNL